MIVTKKLGNRISVQSVADQHHFDADPDLTFHLMRIRIQLSTLMQIRILLFTLLRTYPDPDPASQNYADPDPQH